jgi:outer membrane protein OmpA-like peptidoglycan-associated protein
MKHRDFLRTGIVLASGGLVLAACSSTPQPNAALNQAKATYARASSDPMVQTSAPEKLADAQDSLQIAQEAWNNSGNWWSTDDKATVDHNAYLAQRYAETAIEAAKFRTAAAQASNAARIITLPGVLFETGKADLNAQGVQAADDLGNFLRVRADRTVVISGYTDNTGPARINAALSAARAEVVKTALVHQGIEPSRIQTKGLGPSNPVASNASPDGRQKNRRVEVAISEGSTSELRSSAPQ